MSFRSSTLGEIVFAIPTAIRWLVGLCLLVWIGELVSMGVGGGRGAQFLFGECALSWSGITGWKLWQFVTYQFLHDPASPLHLVFNMFTLWSFGRELEQRWGAWAFLRFYLACGIGGGIAHLFMTRLLLSGEPPPVIGASGAVLGVLAAFAMLWPRRQVLLIVIPMEARFLVLLTVILNLVFAWRPGSGVANLAHLGGMATGWAYLRHGWRVRSLMTLGGRIRAAAAERKRQKRREKFHVVDRDWDKWLKENDPDDRSTRH